MEPARPLRDVFADLVSDDDVRRAHAADPDGFLQAHGHAELPGSLLSEAIVNYADTAPAEVAEHLAPFVMANSPVPVDDPAGDMDPADGLNLLATAPVELTFDELPDDLSDEVGFGGSGNDTDPDGDDVDDPFDLDFGHGVAADLTDAHVAGDGGTADMHDPDDVAGPTHAVPVDVLPTGPEPGADQPHDAGLFDHAHDLVDTDADADAAEDIADM
jgi:hypothetical protein